MACLNIREHREVLGYCPGNVISNSRTDRPGCWAVYLIRRAASDRQATTTYSFHLSVLLKRGQPMAVKIITMKIVSKKPGKAIEVSFPMGEGLFKASFSLPKKKHLLFLTEAYHEFKCEEKRKRRLLFLESMLEDCTEFKDGLVDDSLNPEEQCLRNERDILLYDAISKLNERQRKVIVEHFTMGRLRDNWPKKWA